MPKVTCGFATRRRIINVTVGSGQEYGHLHTIIVTYTQVGLANTTFFLPFLYVISNNA